MEAIENDEDWTLMSEHECPGLSNNYGEDFDKFVKPEEMVKPSKK